MTFTAAICPSCGGALQVPDDRTVVKCMFCGVDVIVKDAIQAAQVNPANLIRLAQAAVSADNYREAYVYYSKALEFDSGNCQAWLGRGISAGRLSSLTKPRLEEMFTSMEAAIRCAPEDQEDAFRDAVAAAIDSVIHDYYEKARRHFESHPDLERWNKYIQLSNLMIQALEKGHQYVPSNRSLMEGVIQICTDNLAGWNFGRPGGYFGMLKQQIDSHVAIRTTYTKKLQDIDPAYQSPNVTIAQGGPCFIAAATMGSNNHPVVISLKNWRDSQLLERTAGRVFVRMYYTLGSYPAKVISKSTVLRNLSYWMIIRPLSWWIRNHS